MKFKLVRFAVLCVFLPLSIQSQSQEEYKAEIGVSGGGSYYIGDANSLPFNNLNMAFSGFFRYRFDPRLAARVELAYAVVSGPNFNSNVIATDFCGEFNFFDLEKNEYKQFSKTFSPYIFTGVGILTNVAKISPEMSIPFGVGFKLKLSDRWNLDVKWSNRLLIADNLEGTKINTPYNNMNYLNRTNLLNKDLLSTFTVGISFDIWKKHCDCVNSATTKEKNRYIK